MTTDPLVQARFAELLESHRRILFKVVNTYAFNREDRDELAQEIAAQLWRAFPAYDPQRAFATWMYRIALNVAISQVRDHRRRGRQAVPLEEGLHDIADDAAADPDTAQRVRALQRFIAGLGRLERALLMLYLEEQPYRQIAEILGITETNVATKLGRLKQRIRNEL